MLSRIQFGFVISFHILFPAFTIGLAHWLAFVEWRWLRTRDDRWRDIYFFWLKIFAVSFGMGVVSGIVMSFQFGTNWAVLSERAGSILGPLLSYEVLTAFFLEATLGMIGFWFLEVGSRVFVLMLFSVFFSGHMFPLDIIPEPWQSIVQFMPLKYLAYFPAAVFLGVVPEQNLWREIAMEAGWVVFFIVFSRWLMKAGFNRYSGFGG